MTQGPTIASRFEQTPENLAKSLFGSNIRISIGIWIVQRETNEPFSVRDAIEAYTGIPTRSDSQIGGYLQSFANFEMLKRLEEPDLRLQRYVKLDHPVWPVFESIQDAFANLPKQLE